MVGIFGWDLLLVIFVWISLFVTFVWKFCLELLFGTFVGTFAGNFCWELLEELGFSRAGGTLLPGLGEPSAGVGGTGGGASQNRPLRY